MNYDEMPAGREMDVLVAERVMGLELREMEIAIGGIVGGPGKIIKEKLWVPKNGPPGYVLNGCLKEYSTYISAAWEVLEKFPRFDLSRYRGKLYCIGIGDDETLAPTAPLAICRAALKSVEESSIAHKK